MLEARIFVIYIDHKLLIFAFRQKSEKSSPRQFCYLDFINQFTTDIRHVSVDENIVADTLSKIEDLQSPMDYSALAKSQETDEELKKYDQHESGLRLEQIDVPGIEVAVFCGTPRPFLNKSFRHAAFSSIHNLAHPGMKVMIKLISQRYVWSSMRVDCRNWARTCVQCQCAKITCNCTSWSIHKTIKKVWSRLHKYHCNAYEGKRYCLTCIDLAFTLFTFWDDLWFTISSNLNRWRVFSFWDELICLISSDFKMS